MGLHPIEHAILQEWKSVKRIHAFLRREFQQINERCFGGQLPFATLQIRRTWLPREPGLHCHILAHYKPPAGGDAGTISLYARALLSRQQARAALAHEMIHHWEATMGHHCSHSDRFRNKAQSIARQIEGLALLPDSQ